MSVTRTHDNKERTHRGFDVFEAIKDNGKGYVLTHGFYSKASPYFRANVGDVIRDIDRFISFNKMSEPEADNE